MARSGGVLGQDVKTYDFDYQYPFPLGERHKITCGAGFRGFTIICPARIILTCIFRPSNARIIDQPVHAKTNHFDRRPVVPGRWVQKLEQNDFTG